MKRSDMIQAISDIIETLYGQDRYNYKVAKDILMMQEKSGMIPPIDNHLFYMDGDNADKNDVIYREWGPEDD